MLEKVAERRELPIYLMEELREYYYSIPLLWNTDAIEGVVVTQMGYIFCDRGGIKIRRNAYQVIDEEEGFREEEEHQLSMEAIQERYACEEQMMEAIRAGDMEKVLEAYKNFRNYRLKPRGDGYPAERKEPHGGLEYPFPESRTAGGRASGLHRQHFGNLCAEDRELHSSLRSGVPGAGDDA